MVSNMMRHLESNNILTDCQYGFRSRRSCDTQLVTLVHELTKSMTGRVQVDMIVMDFSKAFDKVPHQRLLSKLHYYSVQGTTLNWIRSFLLERTQRVIVEGEESEWAQVESGVPQGTVLEPILLLAYINDLPEYVSSSVCLFADDCVLFCLVKLPEDTDTLESDLNSLAKW